MATGGTAPGVPKGPPGVPGKPGAVPRFLNRASGKMETAAAMKGYRAPAASQHLSPAKTGPTHPESAGRAPAPAKSWLEMNPAETHQYAARQVQQNTQAELQPFRQKAGEISGTEQAVSSRYGGYGQALDTQIAGLQGQAAAGAKTLNNTMADSVLKAQQSVDTTGQTAQAANAGYMDPQLRATLAAQSGNIQATGTAAQTAAQNQGQGEQNLMANMRAAAAQRVTEGQKGIAGTYGKQRQQNTNEENRLLARVPGAATKLETELGQKQFNARATEAGLNIKLGATQQKAVETKERVGATVRGQNQANARNRENVQAKETASLRSARLNEMGKNTAKMSAEDKARYDAARIRIDEQNKSGKAANPKEGRSYMAKLSTAEAIARSILGKEPKSKTAQERARAELTKKGASGDVTSAALNLAVYGRLGESDEAAALSYGMTSDMRPQWFPRQSSKR